MNNETFSIEAEYRRLSNGKYVGVVTQSLVGRISTDTFELICPNERDSAHEALWDAQMLIQERGPADNAGAGRV